MEGGGSSYCFICGGSFQVKESPLMRRCDSFKDLKELVLRLCGLLGVEVTPGEWEEVDGDYLMKQTIACEKCFEILKSVERVHEVLLRTQQELKAYLDEVESLIIRSETPNLQVSFWRSGCFKLRRSVLEKVTPAANVGDSYSHSIQIKEECYGGQSAQTLYEASTVDNHFIDDDWDAASASPPHSSLDHALVADNGPITCQDGVIPMSSVTANTAEASQRIPRKNRKRKITVIAEEDEVPVAVNDIPIPPLPKETRKPRNAKKKATTSLQLYTSSRDAEEDEVPVVNDIPIPSRPKETRKPRNAKKIAATSLQLYTSSRDSSDNDNDLEYNPNANHHSPQADSRSKVEDASDDSEEEARKEESSLEKARRHRKRLPLPTDRERPSRGQIRQFMIVEENLFLYRWDTYVLYTRSHLECLAHKCGFKTEFDFYPSFQRMRAHMEEKHRNRRHRQRTPHPCIPCQTMHKNREDFNNHFNKAHSQLMKPQRAVCECCLSITSRNYLLAHMFTHKNPAEKADAIAINAVPWKCLPSEKEPSKLKYICPYENCTYTTNDLTNFKRHKRRHLPKEQRSDYTICPECGAHILKDSFKDHMRNIHHSETIDLGCSLQCHICERKFRFGQRYKFDAHMRKHKGERPYLCTECGKSYADQGSLSYHVTSVHNPNPQEWPCQWCDMVYLKKGSLKHHVLHKHPDKWKPKTKYRTKRADGEKEEVKGEVYGPKQMFPCPHCDVICGYNFTLKKHLCRKHGIGEMRKRGQTSYRRKKEEEDESRSMSAGEEEERMKMEVGHSGKAGARN